MFDFEGLLPPEGLALHDAPLTNAIMGAFWGAALAELYTPASRGPGATALAGMAYALGDAVEDFAPRPLGLRPTGGVEAPGIFLQACVGGLRFWHNPAEAARYAGTLADLVERTLPDTPPSWRGLLAGLAGLTATVSREPEAPFDPEAAWAAMAQRTGASLQSALAEPGVPDGADLESWASALQRNAAVAVSHLTEDFEPFLKRLPGLDHTLPSAIAGALWGARHGFTALPETWVSALDDPSRLTFAALALARIVKAEALAGLGGPWQPPGWLGLTPDSMLVTAFLALGEKERYAEAVSQVRQAVEAGDPPAAFAALRELASTALAHGDDEPLETIWECGEALLDAVATAAEAEGLESAWRAVGIAIARWLGEAFEDAVHPSAYITLAQRCEDLDDVASAEALLTLGLRLAEAEPEDPDTPWSRRALGATLASLLGHAGRLEEAAHVASGVLQDAEAEGDDEHLEMVHFNLGLSYARAGRPAEALGHFQAAERFDPEIAQHPEYRKARRDAGLT